MKNVYLKLAYTVVLAFALSGCETMQDLVGKHMPVVGEPCENWQCFTSSGQAESDAKRHAREAGGKAESKRIPINGETKTPGVPAQPAPAKDPTPFDMQPDQLDSMPTHDPSE